MSLPGWRENTIKLVAQVLGPVAEIIVDDTIKSGGFQEDNMVPSNFLKFLEALYKELPEDIDKRTLIYRLRDNVLKKYGFARK